jgi:hypothetical protein
MLVARLFLWPLKIPNQNVLIEHTHLVPFHWVYLSLIAQNKFEFISFNPGIPGMNAAC